MKNMSRVFISAVIFTVSANAFANVERVVDEVTYVGEEVWVGGASHLDDSLFVPVEITEITSGKPVVVTEVETVTEEKLNVLPNKYLKTETAQKVIIEKKEGWFKQFFSKVFKGSKSKKQATQIDSSTESVVDDSFENNIKELQQQEVAVTVEQPKSLRELQEMVNSVEAIDDDFVEVPSESISEKIVEYVSPSQRQASQTVQSKQLSVDSKQISAVIYSAKVGDMININQETNNGFSVVRMQVEKKYTSALGGLCVEARDVDRNQAKRYCKNQYGEFIFNK